MADVNNMQDILDSRDVIERIEELEAEFIEDALQVDLDELKALKELAEEASGTPDWVYGETLIRESYFRDYAEQLADDLGLINAEATWPTCHIDWDAAAEALKIDYFEVDFDGVTYLVRS